MQLAADARGGISHLLRIILIQTGTYELQTIDLASKAVAVSRFMVVEGALPAGLARALEPGASTTSRWPSSLVGTWQGRVAPNGAALRPVLITLTGGETGAVVGTIAYPSLECGGELWLMNAPGDPVLGEHITYGQERCSGAGLVTVRLGKDGALEIQRTEAGHPAAPSAIGTLPKRM
jgi:hypothetical protein